jgi:hypothetical protein
MGPCVGSGRVEKFPLPVRPLFRQTENVTQSISVKQKRRGRPATGTDQIVGVRLEAETIKALDRLAIRENIYRSGIIRRLIELGLKAAKAEK